MQFKKLIAFALTAVCAVGFASCGDKEKKDSEDKTAEIVQNVGENEVSELITPDENSDEYSLGSYRLSSNGTKLYWEDETIPTELMLALEKYFINIQNGDFEGYKASLYPDYAERYNKYLIEDYSETLDSGEKYDLEDSFNLRCSNIKDSLIDTLIYESTSDEDFTGDYKIVRIRGERVIFEEGQTEESCISDFLSSYDEMFDMDYEQFVTENSDGFECLTFFVFVEAEDGNEHKILSEVNIVMVEKDGKYYTFG